MMETVPTIRLNVAMRGQTPGRYMISPTDRRAKKKMSTVGCRPYIKVCANLPSQAVARPPVNR